jgi:hypothetical protein
MGEAGLGHNQPQPQNPLPPQQQNLGPPVVIPAPLAPNVGVVSPMPQQNAEPGNPDDDDIIVLD